MTTGVPVVPEELVAVVPAGHPLAQQEQVTLEQWKALTRAYFSMKKSR